MRQAPEANEGIDVFEEQSTFGGGQSAQSVCIASHAFSSDPMRCCVPRAKLLRTSYVCSVALVMYVPPAFAALVHLRRNQDGRV